MDPISSTTAPGTTAAQAAPPNPAAQLGENDFLKLLTAQLSNQDPLQPVDNQAFIAQLAQFSSLEQLHGVSTRLDSLLLATSSQAQLGAASLVGKTVTYQPDSGAPVTGKVDGVDLANGEAALVVGGTEVQLSQVTRIVNSP